MTIPRFVATELRVHQAPEKKCSRTAKDMLQIPAVKSGQLEKPKEAPKPATISANGKRMIPHEQMDKLYCSIHGGIINLAHVPKFLLRLM